MTHAFLGLGSNLGERRTLLAAAVASMPDLAAVSPLYETDPVGGPEQGAFLNLVVELDTARSARDLLALCGALEAAADRVREVRWGPRTLDVDVLWIDGETFAEPDLVGPASPDVGTPLRAGPAAGPRPRPGPAEQVAAAEGDVHQVGPL